MEEVILRLIELGFRTDISFQLNPYHTDLLLITVEAIEMRIPRGRSLTHFKSERVLRLDKNSPISKPEKLKKLLLPDMFNEIIKEAYDYRNNTRNGSKGNILRPK